MKQRLQERFDRAVQQLGAAKQYLVNDNTTEFSEVISSSMEALIKVQDDLAIYDEVVALRKENEALKARNAELEALVDDKDSEVE